VSKLTLLKKIEACRQEMTSLYASHSLTSDVMIESSMRLDKLINKYQNYEKYELASR